MYTRHNAWCVADASQILCFNKPTSVCQAPYEVPYMPCTSQKFKDNPVTWFIISMPTSEMRKQKLMKVKWLVHIISQCMAKIRIHTQVILLYNLYLIIHPYVLLVWTAVWTRIEDLDLNPNMKCQKILNILWTVKMDLYNTFSKPLSMLDYNLNISMPKDRSSPTRETKATHLNAWSPRKTKRYIRKRENYKAQAAEHPHRREANMLKQSKIQYKGFLSLEI